MSIVIGAYNLGRGREQEFLREFFKISRSDSHPPLILPALYPPINLRRYLPFAVILLAYLAGLWIDVMEIDATQYAGMSRSIMESGDYFHFYDHGRPYLDKPPLTFWLTALSFRLFGVATWSYKLPSILFSLLAVLGTERLASLLHNRRTGELAALVLASTQAVFLMNNDVKIDMYMIAPMVLGIWLLVKWLRGGGWRIF